LLSVQTNLKRNKQIKHTSTHFQEHLKQIKKWLLKHNPARQTKIQSFKKHIKNKSTMSKHSKESQNHDKHKSSTLKSKKSTPNTQKNSQTNLRNSKKRNIKNQSQKTSKNL